MNTSASEDFSSGSTERPVARLFVMIVVGVVASLISFFAVGAIGTVYPTAIELMNLGAAPTDEERATAMAAQLAVNQGNAQIQLGAIGAILGAIIPLALGWLRGAKAKTAIGVITGIVVAGGLGYLAGNRAVGWNDGFTANLIGNKSDYELDFMTMHAVTWALIGLGVGLGCALGSPVVNGKSVCVSIAIAGIMGALGGALFPLGVAVVAPLADSSLPIPAEGMGRQLWIGLGAVLMSIGVSRASN